MGTNFTWRTGDCTACGRFDEHHVGKSSAGWSCLFRAYPHRLISAAHPDWGHDPASPFGHPVLSRADWRTVFAAGGQLRNEYGEIIPDALAWLAALTPPDADKRAWEDSQTGAPLHRDREWRDREGFRFYAGEFS